MVWNLDDTIPLRGGVRQARFGRLPNGEVIDGIEIGNASGLRLRVITFGAAIHSVFAPDRDGRHDNVVLNYPALSPYLERPEFFGAAVGRYANRIGGAAFELDGARHVLTANEGTNVLHGGADGFDRVVWRVDSVEAGDAPCIRLSHRSPHGDQGFPGTLDVKLVYALSSENELRLTFEATTDQTTVVSLTSHPYFNLGGAHSGRDVLGHVLQLDADAYTPVDSAMIPTGEIRSVTESPFDFREPRTIGAGVARTEDSQIASAGGFDHNFVLREGLTDTPKRAARVIDPESGRVLDLLTTEPGLQVYSGQKLGQGEATTPALYHRFGGLALEPQCFPDAPNKPHFPSARLEPGRIYRHVSIYRFSVVPR